MEERGDDLPQGGVVDCPIFFGVAEDGKQNSNAHAFEYREQYGEQDEFGYVGTAGPKFFQFTESGQSLKRHHETTRMGGPAHGVGSQLKPCRLWLKKSSKEFQSGFKIGPVYVSEHWNARLSMAQNVADKGHERMYILLLQ